MRATRCFRFVCICYQLMHNIIHCFSDLESRQQIAMQRAANHVKSGYKGLDIISQCQLESVYRRSSALSILFKIQNHYLWTIFMHLVVIAHVAMSFVESKKKRNNDTWYILGREFYVGVKFNSFKISCTHRYL